jgi:hypothetical protein
MYSTNQNRNNVENEKSFNVVTKRAVATKAFAVNQGVRIENYR